MFKYLLNKFITILVNYRSDSDIPIPFGKMRYQPDLDFVSPTAEDINGSKTKGVAWMPSTCNPKSKRELFVKKLRKYVLIGLYGQCGDLPCGNGADDNCADIFEQHKFFLSYENANCKDYISKGTWEALGELNNVVPIVRGGAKYEDLVPPGSVINLREFGDAEAFAKYLIYLHTHMDEYLKYFRWKEFYKVDMVRIPCELCKKLHTEQLEEGSDSFYDNVEDWWMGTKNGDGFSCEIK